MQIKRVTVSYELGLCLRPAARFVNLSNQFGSEVFVAKDDARVDGKSTLSIITLGADRGSEITIEAEGKTPSKRFKNLLNWWNDGSICKQEFDDVDRFQMLI